jgi:hypothetical protein
MGKNKKIYLVGSMEAAADFGAGWRAEITPFLQEELGFEVLDPVLFEPRQLRGCHLNDLPEYITTVTGERIKVTRWHDMLQADTRTEDGKRYYNRALGYMRRIVEFDCNVVNKEADVILCLWDQNLMKGAGSQSELTLAFLRGLPVYVVATCRMAAWSKGCATHIELTWEAMKERLRKDFGKKESK